MDLRRLIEALHVSRHLPTEVADSAATCPFHDARAFEAEARKIAWLIAAGIGRRS